MGLELDKALNAHRDKTREGQWGMARAHEVTKNQKRRHRNPQKRIPRNHERGATGYNNAMIRAILVCNLLHKSMGLPAYQITYPILDITFSGLSALA